MEPCAVALAIVVTTPLAPLPPGLRPWSGPVLLVQALWTGTAAVRSSVEAMETAPRKRAALASARADCGASDDDVVVADEPGLEWMLDGRMIEQPLVFTQLISRGVLSLDMWRTEWSRPEVRCLVMQSDLLSRPEAESDPTQDLLPLALRNVVRARFEPVGAKDGVWLYRARRSP
jgi:hypothetical protein